MTPEQIELATWRAFTAELLRAGRDLTDEQLRRELRREVEWARRIIQRAHLRASGDDGVPRQTNGRVHLAAVVAEQLTTVEACDAVLATVAEATADIATKLDYHEHGLLEASHDWSPILARAAARKISVLGQQVGLRRKALKQALLVSIDRTFVRLARVRDRDLFEALMAEATAAVARKEVAHG